MSEDSGQAVPDPAGELVPVDAVRIARVWHRRWQESENVRRELTEREVLREAAVEQLLDELAAARRLVADRDAEIEALRALPIEPRDEPDTE